MTIKEHKAIYEESRDIYGRHCIAKYELKKASVKNESSEYEKGKEIGNWQVCPYNITPQEKNGIFSQDIIALREKIFGKYESVRNKHYKASVHIEWQN